MLGNVKSIAVDIPLASGSESPRTGPTPLTSVRSAEKSGDAQSISTASRIPPYRRTPGWWRLVDALSMVMGHS
jgi:hypothetical protein